MHIFFVGKSYKEILEDNEYNAKIEDFITLINAQIGRQSFSLCGEEFYFY